MEKIRNFTDIVCWKESHKLVIDIYKITKTFPKEETYGLSDQMRRCSVSITSNIAEGFSRKSVKEKIQFYYMSKGSLTELENQIIIAKDIGYINLDTFKVLSNQLEGIYKLLNAFIKGTRNINAKF